MCYHAQMFIILYVWLFYLYGCFACIYVCVPRASQKLEGGVGALGTRITVVSHYVLLRIKSGPLEPSPQSLTQCLIMTAYKSMDAFPVVSH